MTESREPARSSQSRPQQLRSPARVHAALIARGESVAVAESLTGGLLSAALTTTPGASTTFRGGLVVYATDLKSSVAGVDPLLLAERGAVDPAVALELARGARDRLGADWGIGVTGVAGPDPQDGQPVGTVFVGIVGPAGPPAGSQLLTELNLVGDRNRIRSETVVRAIELFLRAILDETG